MVLMRFGEDPASAHTRPDAVDAIAVVEEGSQASPSIKSISPASARSLVNVVVGGGEEKGK